MSPPLLLAVMHCWFRQRIWMLNVNFCYGCWI